MKWIKSDPSLYQARTPNLAFLLTPNSWIYMTFGTERYLFFDKLLVPFNPEPLYFVILTSQRKSIPIFLKLIFGNDYVLIISSFSEIKVNFPISNGFMMHILHPNFLIFYILYLKELSFLFLFL